MRKWLSNMVMPAALVVAATACGGNDQQAAAPADTTSMATGAPPAAAPAPDTGAAGAPAAPGATAANLPAGVTPAMVQEGQQIFTGPGLCYTCHGPDAHGTALAPNLTDNQWIWLQDGPDLYQKTVDLIHAGVPQPKEHPAPMPPMGGASLTDDQVKAVAAYVYSLTHGA